MTPAGTTSTRTRPDRPWTSSSRATSTAGEPGLYDPIRDALLTHGDYYMHLADLASYAATQSRVSDLYADRRGLGPQGHPQRRPLREVLERPDDRGIRRVDLGGGPRPRSPSRPSGYPGRAEVEADLAVKQ